ncbi:hypothetical protein CC78DRAFT_576944 [Lojkania enalia]|uniref:Uncharacterized protein n=1 Tax=Lojkania enalia TaxID=147567 RepID=A0A9P4KGI4_9PLEO|nr:hypothetical protein CC78DRAFT_576944 [Didymosphaeria enalia]
MAIYVAHARASYVGPAMGSYPSPDRLKFEFSETPNVIFAHGIPCLGRRSCLAIKPRTSRDLLLESGTPCPTETLKSQTLPGGGNALVTAQGCCSKWNIDFNRCAVERKPPGQYQGGRVDETREQETQTCYARLAMMSADQIPHLQNRETEKDH